MEKLSPLKVGLYLVGGAVVIVTHIGELPGVMALILREAFSIGAVTGGTAGAGIMVAARYGIARGIYANEAGYGTAAVAYGTARSERPVQQGLNAVMETFIVSMLTSSISAFSILLSGAWSSPAVRAGEIKGTAVVAAAFDSAMPGFGGIIVGVCAFLFGYTTLIGWAYYGEQFLEHILGPRVTLPYRWIYCLLIPLGAMARVDVVWAWGDLMNGLQIFPNLVGVLGLSGLVASLAREDRARRA
jgi:AGCS family alanine or glycine:cation symporter